MLVEETDLSTRTRNALTRGGYYSMDDVLAADEYQLRRLTEFGDRALREVTEWARANGKMAGKERRMLQRQLEAMEGRQAILTLDIEALKRRLAK